MFLFANLLDFDWVILVWAVVTGILWYRTKKYVGDAHKVLYIPSKRRSNIHTELPDERTEDEIKEDEDRLTAVITDVNRWYALFSGFTSVFPLWGMLGTVISLIKAAGVMDAGGVAMDEFFGALSSTAWGIIFGIIFKAGFDSFISPKVAAANKEYDLLLERNSRI